MNAFDFAKQVYAGFDVDVEKAFERLNNIPVSIHCWQGDDVNGFENDSALDGGIQVTGNHPGKARNEAYWLRLWQLSIAPDPNGGCQPGKAL